MSMSAEWRKSLSFSGRFASVAKIGAAYKKANPDASDADCRHAAKVAENTAYGEAFSLDEYNDRCSSIISKFEDDATHRHVEGLEHDGYMSESESIGYHEGGNIGKYTNAVYHRSGTTSTVFKARLPLDKSSDGKPTMVALKVTEAAGTQAPHDYRREIRVLRRAAMAHVIPLLDDFPLPAGPTGLKDYVATGSRHVLAFPFMRYDLPALLQSACPSFTDRNKRSCLKDVFSALAHLHSMGIIHRDVKPANILLDSIAGPAYLADFGIVWDPADGASEPADRKITDVGTTCYRPIELMFGNTSYGPALDMWAAGCVVAEVMDVTVDTLFDAGPLGSELGLIQSVFSKLGTPTLEMWPEAASLRDWGKFQYQEYATKPWNELLPQADGGARDLVSNLVRYESGERLLASEVLNHGFFAGI